MSFLTVVSSIQGSRPVELYSFTRGTETWRYASCAETIEYEGNTYVPYPIQRGRIKQTEDMFKNVVDFTFPRGSSFAMHYIQNSVVQMTKVKIIRGNPATSDYQQWWQGRIIGGRMPKKNTILIECEPIYTSLKRPGLRALYEITCCHSLYEEGCELSKDDYVRSVNITDITGRVITVDNMSGVDAGWFSGGMIESSTLKRYYISIQTDDKLTIFLKPELEVGEALSIYPGCDHISDTCINKFNNKLNYLGFEWMPDTNPYEGMSLH